MSFFLSSVYENAPVLQTCKAKLQHLQRVKQCLLLLKPHSIEVFRQKKSGDLIFLYQKRLFANLKAFRTLETLEKKEPDLLFLLTADFQYLFLTIIEKKFIIIHRGEVFDAPKYEFISLLNQIDLKMDSVKGFLGILLISRHFRELKVLEYEFEAAKDLSVSKLKTLEIEKNECLLNLIDMTPEKNSFVLGGLYKFCEAEYVFNECIFWYDSVSLNVRNVILAFNDPCNGVFYQPFAREIYTFFPGKVSVWQKKKLKVEFELKIDFGAFIDLVDSVLVSDKKTGGLYLITPKQKETRFLGFVNLCSSFEILNKNRIFAGSRNDDSVVFEVVNEKELFIHERNYKPGYIKQVIPVERDGARSLLINSAAKREPLNILQRGVGINEEVVLNFNENSLGMHVLRNSGLVILVFPGKNLLLSVNNESISIFKPKSEAFEEVLNFEILKIFEFGDIFAVITRNKGTFVFNSLDQELICQHKCQGEVFFSAEHDHCLFWVCFFSDGSYGIFALNMKKPTEITTFSIHTPNQISSFCPLNFDSFIISYWFDLNLKIVRPSGILEECPFFSIPNSIEFSSSISISSMVMATKNHLCIGLNNGRFLIYKITQNELDFTFQELKSIDLGDQPVYFRVQPSETIFVLSDKVLLVKFAAETVQKLPVLMSEMVSIDTFFGEKAIFLKSNKIILGSFKSFGGFTVTPCQFGEFEGGAIVAPGENSFIVGNLGENPCIRNVSNIGQEINATFDNFDQEDKIASIAFDSKNQVALVLLMKPYQKSKIMAFSAKKNKFSLFQEMETKKESTNFVKFLMEGRFVIGGGSSVSILKFSKENKKIQTELVKETLMQIYKMETSRNLIICFDVFSKVEIYQYDEEKNSLSRLRSLFADFMIDGGLVSQNLSFFFEKQQKFCGFTKIDLKTRKMGISKHFKLSESVNFSLILGKNGSALDKFKAGSVVWATEYGNLEILVNLEGEIFAVLRKIEQKIKESLVLNKQAEIFSYEKWRKLNEIVIFFKFFK